MNVSFCMRFRVVLFIAGLISLASLSVVAQERRPLTVEDCIESTRVLSVFGNDPVLISPDGKKYLVVLQTGDLSRNGSWIELIAGSTTSIQAAKPNTIARLFSQSRAEANDLIKNVRWLSDNDHVSFLWDDGHAPRRLVEVSVQTHHVEELTHHRTPVVDYDIGNNGKTIIFIAQAAHDEAMVSEFTRKGFTISNQSIWALLDNNIDGWTPWRHYETFLISSGRERRVNEPVRTWSTPPELLRLSPDAKYAVAVGPADKIPLEWNAYTEHVFKDAYLPAAREHPQEPNWIRQYFIIDIKDGILRPLWNAPEDPHGRVVWSPDSRSVVIGPTFLPVKEADPTGLGGRAVAAVNVADGSFIQLPLPADSPDLGFRPFVWRPDGTLELRDAAISAERDTILRFQKIGGEWKSSDREVAEEKTTSGKRIEVKQDLNTPPAIYAVNPDGSDLLLRDLNPQLKTTVTLGRVEVIHWKGTDARPWTGVLYYPVHYQTGKRFPLVIQTHGYSVKNFSLEGTFTTAFAAQPLANRDIAVLQLGGPDRDSAKAFLTEQEGPISVAGIEGAAQHLIATGVVDRTRVGIIGFSWTVFTVEYVLTHSDFPFAAAEAADGIDGGYFQYVLGDASQRQFSETEKGVAPFGHGLEAWMREAPGFNVDKIQTPLRLEIDSGPISEILEPWETFSHLRYLKRPVELFVIPDIQHGTHVLQNPAQRLASQTGTVDWFCFWLKGEEDTGESKSAQYHRWRELRNLQHPVPVPSL